MTIWIITGLVLLSAFLFWRFYFFFRNPPRTIRHDDAYILAPADGYVVYLRRVLPGEPVFSIKKGRPVALPELMEVKDPSVYQLPAYLLGIYMTAADVHYNRMPIRGYLEKIAHCYPDARRKNHTMFNAMDNLLFRRKPYYDDCEYLVTNERAAYLVRNEDRSVYLTQIADRWISKVVSLRDREKLDQGEIFGLIRMGSQVDLLVPDPAGAIEPVVEPGERVKAGLSVVFRIKELKNAGHEDSRFDQ